MSLAEAQGDVRRIYVGGFYGQLVSAGVWLSAAAVATWVSTEGAVAVLFLGGTVIFPPTWLAGLLRLSASSIYPKAPDSSPLSS